MNSLALYENACSALAQCTTAIEVEDIINKAEAVRIYARMAKDLTLEIKAAKLRIEAERRLGEIIEQSRRDGTLKTRGRSARKAKCSDAEHLIAPISLDGVGISRKEAARACKYAAMPAEVFSEEVAMWEKQSQESGKTKRSLPCATEKPRKKTVVIEHKEDAVDAEFKCSDAEHLTDVTFQSLYEAEVEENTEKSEKIAALEAEIARMASRMEAFEKNAVQTIHNEQHEKIATLEAENASLKQQLKAVEGSRDYQARECAKYLNKYKYWKKYACELEQTYNHQRPQKVSTYCTGSGYSDENDPRHIEWLNKQKEKALADELAKNKAAAHQEKKQAAAWLAQNNLPADDGYRFNGKQAAAQATREPFADNRPKPAPAPAPAQTALPISDEAKRREKEGRFDMENYKHQLRLGACEAYALEYNTKKPASPLKPVNDALSFNEWLEAGCPDDSVAPDNSTGSVTVPVENPVRTEQGFEGQETKPKKIPEAEWGKDALSRPIVCDEARKLAESDKLNIPYYFKCLDAGLNEAAALNCAKLTSPNPFLTRYGHTQP